MMELHMFIIAVTCLFCCGIRLSSSFEEEEPPPRVITSLGIIEGFYKTSSNGRRYEAYEGIPYAEPPIKESRFRVAESVLPWTGVLMAKQSSQKCLQYNQYPCDPAHIVEGTEDCLYMNIYTPIKEYDSSENCCDEIGASNITNLKPVMFYIHGGAFQYGSAVEYGPKYLLDKNVTLVTFNYRLGPLGFLSTEDEIVPGNMGLKDQVIALRWVRDNVKFFGGDPSRVTIFGHSAGGASVHYHYLTNLTRGLFQGGMSLSGTALNCWSQSENSPEKAKKLSTIVGCSTDNIQLMVDCLRARPGHQIVEAVGKFMPWLYNPYTPFGPVIEKGGSEFTFIDQSPIEIITSGKVQDVPWITGLTSEEGLYPAAHFVDSEKLLKELNDNWETIAPHLLDFNYTIPKIDHPKVARLIKEHYLGTNPIDTSTVVQTIRMVGDRLFVYDAKKAARLQARANRSPVRFSYFAYRGAMSASETMCGSKRNFGVSHEDDILYVMEAYLDPTTTQEDRDMQKELINLWVSFATDGLPNVGIEWPVVNGSTKEFQYLHMIGPKKIGTNETTASFGERNFWRSVGFQENIY